jgi:hypothetical protein
MYLPVVRVVLDEAPFSVTPKMYVGVLPLGHSSA